MDLTQRERHSSQPPTVETATMSSEHEKSQKALDKLCEKLRKNSKTINGVSLYGKWFEQPPNHAAQLGPALLNSTVVSEFSINLNHLNSIDDVKPFLPFLRTNQHLRKLTLSGQQHFGLGPTYVTFAGLVLDSASENLGIEEIHLNWPEPLDSILKFIQGAKPRVLRLERFAGASVLDRIGMALLVNPNLYELTLVQPGNVQLLLQHLVSLQAPPLEILTIWFDHHNDGSNLATALAAFVAGTTTLRQLKLYRFHAETTIEPLVNAFKVNQSINDLVFGGNLGGVAAKELTTFLQSSDAATNGIRHLDLSSQSLEGAELGVHLSSFLGPSLHSLKLESVNAAVHLLVHLLKTGTSDRLPSLLHVRGVQFSSLRELAALLARVDGLADLTLEFWRRQGGHSNPMSLLLAAVQQNWSLTRVSLVLGDGEPYFKNETAETKMMQVYFTRNAAVPALLAGDSSQGEPTDVLGRCRRRHVTPSLFVLNARHESQTTRNNIFKGVFAMEAEAESDGHRAKRPRLA